MRGWDSFCPFVHRKTLWNALFLSYACERALVDKKGLLIFSSEVPSFPSQSLPPHGYRGHHLSSWLWEALMGPGRRCLFQSGSPFSEGYLLAPGAAMGLISSSWVPWQHGGGEGSLCCVCVCLCVPVGGLENWLWVYIPMCAWSVANYGWACPAQQFPKAGSSTKPVERLALHSSLVSSARENPEPVCVCMSVRW